MSKKETKDSDLKKPKKIEFFILPVCGTPTRFQRLPDGQSVPADNYGRSQESHTAGGMI